MIWTLLLLIGVIWLCFAIALNRAFMKARRDLYDWMIKYNECPQMRKEWEAKYGWRPKVVETRERY